MKILWLSNRIISSEDAGSTGTWLTALAKALVESPDIEFGNIAIGSSKTFAKSDVALFPQWVVPSGQKIKSDGLPSAEIVAEIAAAVEKFNPDLVHVWGTESFWGLLTARRIIQSPALLETQGLKFAIAKVYAGDLRFHEKLSCIGIKEVLRGSSIFSSRLRFVRWGQYEQEMIFGHQHLAAQTDWLEAQLRSVNCSASMYRNDFMLRRVFSQCRPWRKAETTDIFTTSAYPAPFKGLHVAIRAIGHLTKRIPGVRLRIAGALARTGIRQDGYIAWVQREIRRLGIERSVEWMGPLSSEQISSILQTSAAVVIPSFIEGYCLGLAEAMMVGTPSVAAYSGGIPCIAQDNETALFFQPGDDVMCAWQLERLMTDRDLAMRLSESARATALVRHNPARIVQKQLEIYQNVINRGIAEWR
jgi:glycosyltransferase involved in cell wall biosynthesis